MPRGAAAAALLPLLSAAASLRSATPGGRVTIAPGVEMPVVSNGYIYGVGPGAGLPDTAKAIETWFRVGGRGLDTAWKYRNQKAYGRAIQSAVQSGVPREEIFVTTKIPCTGDADQALAVVRDDVAQLGTHADAVLIHGTGYVGPFMPGDPPQCYDPPSPGGKYTPCCQDMAGIQATWRGLEMALAQNLTRAIGVSNFQTTHLKGVLATAKVPPALDQCEEYVGRPDYVAPYDPDYPNGNGTSAATIAFCKAHGITYMAFSPLGSIGVSPKPVLVDPLVREVAAAHNVSTAQVGLRWVAQRGHVLTTASNNEQYDREDLAIDTFALSDAEMSRLNALVIPLPPCPPGSPPSCTPPPTPA